MTHADDVRTVEDPVPSADVPSLTDCDVTVHECSPTRMVFTEDGNSDGWIATDTTVDLLR
ncbi:MAG: hypothetical protein V5A45_05790 [Haloarculaceae archaeon]